MNLKRFQAFTMAEVLVTLVIIGVIAAMTLPGLNTHTKNNEYVAGCLKSYSVLSQTINRMKVDLGPIGFGTKWNDTEEFWKEFSAKLNTAKICAKNEKGCNYTGIPKHLQGNAHTNSYDGYAYNLVTTDGMTFNFSASDCTSKGLSTKRESNCMGRFVVDVNGFKGPNRFGNDMFFFCLVKGEGILPAGIDNNSADCKKGGSGITCAAKVVNEKRLEIK